MEGDALESQRDVGDALDFGLEGLREFVELRLLEERDEGVAGLDLLLVARGTHDPPSCHSREWTTVSGGVVRAGSVLGRGGCRW